MPNGTDAPSDVVVPTLANLVEIKGTQALPAANITISGVKFTANRPTFMEPRTNPSGGDWVSQCFFSIFGNRCPCFPFL